MGTESTLQIREAILRAQQTEIEHKHLESYIRAAVDELHHSITFTDADKTASLMAFVSNYIDRVPDVLEAIIESAKRAGAYADIEKLIAIAVAYFDTPPSSVRKQQGMLSLIDESYLSLRLVEECNDRIQARHGVPLLPIDLAIPNLVVHNLLGDKFANELDLAVHYAVSALFKHDGSRIDEAVGQYLSKMQQDDWRNILHRWPRLEDFEDSAITLSLTRSANLTAVH
jgi:hypothetical protein